MNKYILICLFIAIAFIHFFGLLAYMIMAGFGVVLVSIYCWLKIRNSKRTERRMIDEEQDKPVENNVEYGNYKSSDELGT